MFRPLLAGTVVVALWSDSGMAQPGVPDPGHSTIPPSIVLVVTHRGVPDPEGTFTVIVRDETGAPLSSVPVTIDFSICSDLWPAAVQSYPGLSVDCAQKRVAGTTDANGQATFVIVGSVLRRSPASTGQCAAIRAGGVLLGFTRVAAWDQDGVDGFGVNDWSLFLCDFLACFLFCGPDETPARSDYIPDGFYTPNDLSAASSHLSSELCKPPSQTGARCDGQPSYKPTLVAGDGGLNVAWSECVSGGGSSLRTSTCLSNSGSQRLVFSVVVLSGVTSVNGFDANVLVLSRDMSPLPDWWRFDACRSGSMDVGDYSGFTCVTHGSSPFAPCMIHPHYAPSAARVRVLGVQASPSDISPGEETVLFEASIDNARTTGTGACSGCGQPVVVVFESVRLVRGGGCDDPASEGAPLAAPPDVLVERAATSNRAYWQAVFTGVEPAPAAPGLALARSGETPARGKLSVIFTIPASAPASLDLFDAGGRRVESHEVGSFGPGTHHFTLGSDRELRPGLYFLRLRQSDESRYLKTTVIR